MNKKLIYVLEDDPDIAYILTYLLYEEGYQVKSFGTVGSCKDAITDRMPDLLILDVQLPDGNGADLCAELKANEKTASSPVLLMSAGVDLNRASQSCANAFIPKPFNLDGMVNKVGNFL